MGCDIHSFAEKKVNDEWVMIPDEHPFDWRSYRLFGFLANVRNYSQSGFIDYPRGLPTDCAIQISDQYYRWGTDGHSASHVLLSELFAFDYDQVFLDVRNSPEGLETNYYQFLGDSYFNELTRLEKLGVDRISFWFDN